MKQRNNNGLLKLLIGAFFLLNAFAASAQTGESVTIKSVDNLGGNSNVYTDKPNTTITVTELDADKKPVRSWTGTTDSDGKLTIQAGSNLSAPYLRAKTADPKMAEFVLPTQISQNEPFMFAATGVVQGEVISVQTVEGEVVATKKADKYGRVFLAAGLAAGTYLLNAGDGRSNKVGSVQVSPDLYMNGVDPKSSLTLDSDIVAIDMVKFGVVEGNFPNIGNLDLDDFVSTRTVPILAATPRQIVFDRPANLGMRPGQTMLTVRDTLTGQSATTDAVFYSASAKLSNVKVPSGAETHLIVTVLPKELEGEVSATILGGPVSFTNGEGQSTMPTSEGQADFRLQSKPGSTGKFDVSWQFSPSELIDKVWDPIKKAWEPVRKGLKSHVWDPIKKKIKELDWTPPKGDTGAKKEDPPKVDGGAKKEDPPKVDEKKQDPPKGGGGDTKALEDDGWVKFVEGGRTGRKKIVRKSDGFEQETKVYDGQPSTSVMITTRTGQKRKTVKTDTTTIQDGERTEVVETMEYEPDGKGGWKPKSGKKETKKIVGGKESVTTETWYPSGWR